MHQGMTGREVSIVPGLSAQSPTVDTAIHTTPSGLRPAVPAADWARSVLLSLQLHIFSLNSDLYSKGFFLKAGLDLLSY